MVAHDAPVGRRNYQECVVVDFPIKGATESELHVAKRCRSQTVRDGVETQPAVSWAYRCTICGKWINEGLKLLLRFLLDLIAFIS